MATQAPTTPQRPHRRSFFSWFENLRIKTKVLTALIAVSVIAAVVGAVALRQMSEINNSLTKVNDGNVERLISLGDTRARLADVYKNLAGYVAITDAGTKTQLKQNAAGLNDKVEAAFGEYERLAVSSAAEKQRIDTFNKAWKTYKGLLMSTIYGAQATSAAQASAAEQQQALQQFEAASTQMNATMDALARAEHDNAEEVAQQAQDDYKADRTLVIVILVLGLALAVLLAIFVANRIVRPLRKVSDVLDAVASGDLTRHVDVESKDEVGQMARALN